MTVLLWKSPLCDMGKLKLFDINLSGSDLVYFSGSNVNGSVLLELSEPKKTKGISIVLSGRKGMRSLDGRK